VTQAVIVFGGIIIALSALITAAIDYSSVWRRGGRVRCDRSGVCLLGSHGRDDGHHHQGSREGHTIGPCESFTKSAAAMNLALFDSAEGEARIMTSHVAAIITLLLTGSVCCSRPSPPAASNAAAPARAKLVALQQGSSDNRWAEFKLDGSVRAAKVFLIHDTEPKPVVFLLQGSACLPLFTVEPDNTYHSTSIFQDVIAPELKRVHFVMVEQPGVKPLQFSTSMSHQQKVEAFEHAGRNCTAEYFKLKTKEVRVDDVLATIEALTTEPWARQVILAGHSEGTDVVTGVLRQKRSAQIAAAGLFASAAPVRFWGGYVASGAGRREIFQKTFDRMRMLQKADDGFMYEGLPARRWKTFWLNSTPLDDVRDSTVPLFVTQGTDDETILAPDLFVLESIRQQPDRALRYIVVESANHAFETTNGKSRIPELFNDFLNWAFDPNRATSLAIVK
jgi:hypothetical protein